LHDLEFNFENDRFEERHVTPVKTRPVEKPE